MKIITINVDISMIDEIAEHITGQDHLTPERSEFVRTALKNFLRKELYKLYQTEAAMFTPVDEQTYLRSLCSQAQGSYRAKLVKNGVHGRRAR